MLASGLACEGIIMIKLIGGSRPTLKWVALCLGPGLCEKERDQVDPSSHGSYPLL